MRNSKISYYYLVVALLLNSVFSQAVTDLDHGFYIASAEENNYDYNDFYLNIKQFYLAGRTSPSDPTYTASLREDSYNYFMNNENLDNVLYGQRRIDSDINFNFDVSGNEYLSNGRSSRAYKTYMLDISRINAKYPYYVAWDFLISNKGVVNYKIKYFFCQVKATAFKDKLNANADVSFIVAKLTAGSATLIKPTSSALVPNCGNYLEYGHTELMKLFNLDSTENSAGTAYPNNNRLPPYHYCGFCGYIGDSCKASEDMVVKVGYGDSNKYTNFYYQYIDTGVSDTFTCNGTNFGGATPNDGNADDYCHFIPRYTKCADAGEYCTGLTPQSTVYLVGMNTNQSVTVAGNTIFCAPTYFNSLDSDFPSGYPNACFVKKGWVFVAAHGNTYNLSGNYLVKYGSGSTWTYLHNTSSSVSGQSCDGSTFGVADNSGYSCYKYDLSD